jgi:hypothetical protein
LPILNALILSHYRYLLFMGEKAWFTDEGGRNKTNFRKEMTFCDPEDTSRNIFCSWHGKINISYPIRIHFSWPITAEQRKIKVVYIGPKITKE